MLILPLKRLVFPGLVALCFLLLTLLWISSNLNSNVLDLNRTKITEFHKYTGNETNKDGVIAQTNRTNTQTLTSVDKLYYNKYFKYKKLQKFSNTLADLSKSRVKILKNDNLNFKVGDTIRLSMELYNVYGDIIPTGGDFIKIWMKDTEKGTGSTGYVIDHGNGSYSGVIRALWSGTPVIKISHSFSKEAIGLFVNHLHKNGMFFKYFGVFKNSHGKTSNGICGTHQHIGDSVCNLTSLNSGILWYCALPGDFICDDRYGPYAYKQTPFTDTEFSFARSNSNRIFKEIQINVKGGPIKDHDIPCNKARPSVTWNNLSPVGFFHQNVWQSLICKDNLSHSVQNYTKCLANREIYMFGDSTLRVWLISMVKTLDLIFTTGPQTILRGLVWHKPAKAQRKSSKEENISVMWMPHELPFLTTMPDAAYGDFKASSYYLENITSKRPVIILHWYIHLSIVLSSMFQEHVQNAKRTIIKFLKRTPDAKIFIKGPHNIDIKSNQGVPHDFIRFYMEDVLFREFQDINDKIFFLNEWDITVASESKETHPPEYINRQMVHNFLTFIC